ncbi:MAG: hypothetical protein AVDCRST_MAG77-1754 [uncultured Chloroflexi bacterium]|uniref:histidine kinase n=1 Tax=uncultured Chloroflexota bacterium TaxID=166587 RepID=A0A6J4IB51_9CHLR|nr:MAG: hypothetical protein AVDCRST_MAG77-1754 [uncultured Chloroflexota bacterium]
MTTEYAPPASTFFPQPRLARGATARAPRVADPNASTIMATACHEIRTPVAALHATVEVLSDHATLSPADIGELVGRLQRSLTWLESMVENLTTSAMAETGDMPLLLRAVSAVECIEAAVMVIEPLVVRRGQRIDLIEPADDVVIHGDSGKITQVLINLLMNACSYSPDGSVIEISVGAREEDVEVRVTDSGPGVASGEHLHIFNRYSRGRAGAGRAAGLGLGLHIVKELIELQGGSVGVERAPEGGASFWFTLQRAPGGSQAAAGHDGVTSKGRAAA